MTIGDKCHQFSVWVVELLNVVIELSTLNCHLVKNNATNCRYNSKYSKYHWIYPIIKLATCQYCQTDASQMDEILCLMLILKLNNMYIC